MYVEHIELRAAPGLNSGVALRDLPPGLVLLVGPNASGKSTLGRVLRGTLWPGEGSDGLDARTVWRRAAGGEALTATLIFGACSWSSEGVKPPAAAAASWRLTLRDLITATGEGSDQAIAAAIQRELDGGYDLAAVERATSARRRRRLAPPAKLKRAWQDAAQALRDRLDETDALQDDERSLASLRRQAAAAAAAPQRTALLRQAAQRLTVLGQLQDALDARDALPDGVADLPTDAVATAEALAASVSEATRDLAARRAALVRARAREADLALPRGDPGEEALAHWRDDAAWLSSAAPRLQALADAAREAAARVDGLSAQVWRPADEPTTQAAPPPLPDRGSLEQLDTLVTALEGAKHALEGVRRSLALRSDEAGLDHLGGRHPVSEAPLDAAGRRRLEAGEETLLRWLAAPRTFTEVVAAEVPRRLLAQLLSVAAVLGLGGVAFTWLGISTGQETASAGSFALITSLGALLLIAGATGLGAALGLKLSPWLSARDDTAVDGAARAGAGEVRLRAAEAEQLAALTRRYAALELPPPETWQAEAVKLRVDDLRQTRQRDERALRRQEERQRRQQQLAAAEADLRDVRALVAAQASRLGLAPTLPSLALRLQADRVLALADALVARGQAERALSRAEDTFERRLSALLAQLSAAGITSDASADADVTAGPLDPTAAASPLQRTVQHLSQRRRSWLEARAAVQRASEAVGDAERTLRRQRGALDAFFQRCGVRLTAIDTASTDESTADGRGERLSRLRARVAAQHRWRLLQTRITLLSGQRDQLDAELTTPSARTALAGVDLDDSAAIDAALGSATAAGERLAELQAQISAIELRIEEATAGKTIADALQRRDELAEAMLADRDKAVASHTAGALLRWLRATRRDSDAPALLRRARVWLLRFTRRRYELRVDGEGRFVVVDLSTGLHQRLSQLSDGTRVQTLLAARLAYIEEAEASDASGSPLPLFLDEVLSTTDAERLDAVADALLQLSQAGRQIFYATANEAEIPAFQRVAARLALPPPRVCRLGVPQRAASDAAWGVGAATPAAGVPVTPARAPSTGVRAARPQLPEAAPWPPRPPDLDAVALVAQLGLARPRLHDRVAGWPVLLLLHDHLDEAWAAAGEGLRTAGQLAMRDAHVPLPLRPELLDLASARAEVVAAALAELRVGRGAPLTWAVVEASEAITPRFEAEAQQALARCGQTPEAFIAALGRVKGFRQKKVAALQTYLTEVGALDPRSPRSSAEVATRVAARCRTHLEAKRLTLAEIAALIALTASVVGLSAQPNAGEGRHDRPEG